MSWLGVIVLKDYSDIQEYVAIRAVADAQLPPPAGFNMVGALKPRTNSLLGIVSSWSKLVQHTNVDIGNMLWYRLQTGTMQAQTFKHTWPQNFLIVFLAML